MIDSFCRSINTQGYLHFGDIIPKASMMFDQIHLSLLDKFCNINIQVQAHLNEIRSKASMVFDHDCLCRFDILHTIINVKEQLHQDVFQSRASTVYGHLCLYLFDIRRKIIHKVYLHQDGIQSNTSIMSDNYNHLFYRFYTLRKRSHWKCFNLSYLE